MTIDFVSSQNDGKTIAVYAQRATFANVPPDCTEWAQRVAKAALDAVRSIPFERNATVHLSAKQFKEKYIVCQCQKCCATCKHGRDLCDDGCYQCKHPALDDDDMLFTSESMVCVAWEA